MARPASAVVAILCLLAAQSELFSQGNSTPLPAPPTDTQPKTREDLLRSFKDAKTVTVTVPVQVLRTQLVQKCVTVWVGRMCKRPISCIIWVKETVMETQTRAEMRMELTDIDLTKFASDFTPFMIPNRHPLTSPDIGILGNRMMRFLTSKTLIDTSSNVHTAPAAQAVGQLTNWVQHPTAVDKEVRHLFLITILNPDNLRIDVYSQSRPRTTTGAGVPDLAQTKMALSDFVASLASAKP